ncbi:MAG: hypothetical protein ACRDG3_11320 [Tepidiformaceae bacterium]
MSWRLSAVVTIALVLGVILARVMQDPQSGTATWDAARAAGFACYLLLWASTVLGMAVHLRYRPAGGPMSWVLEGHRITGTLALSFLIGHVFALLVDPVVTSSMLAGFVPLTSTYRPLQVGLGTVSEWLLVILLASTAFAGSMRYSLWRNVHLVSFPCYVLALIHGITTGTDTGNMQALVIYAGSAGVVASVAVVRVLGRGWAAAPPEPA